MKITTKFNTITQNKKYSTYYNFIDSKHTCSKGKIHKGIDIIKHNMGAISSYWEYLKPLYSLLFRTYWFKDKKAQICTICKETWGKDHMLNCILLIKYKEVIKVWQENGLLRSDLINNEMQLKEEFTQLKEALQIIRGHSMTSEHL